MPVTCSTSGLLSPWTLAWITAPTDTPSSRALRSLIATSRKAMSQPPASKRRTPQMPDRESSCERTGPTCEPARPTPLTTVVIGAP